MSAQNKMVWIQTSIDDRSKGKEIAYHLVNQNLAASVHINEIESLYKWRGDMEDTIEWELKILTSENKINDVHKLIKKLHPYQVAEFLVLEVQSNASTSNWINNITNN